MIILGVDPGISVTGYAVLDLDIRKTDIKELGYIKTNKSTSFPLRLKQIYNRLIEIITERSPQVLVLEDIFYSKNVKTSIKLGHVRGVTLLAAMNSDLETAEYAAREVKMSVTGNGAASKEQVQRMVQQLIKLDCTDLRSDVTDAVAIALCHWHRCKR